MLTGGGARAAVVHRASKLFFFDRFATRGIPDETKDPDGFLLARRLPSLMPSLGRYDLAGDPRELTLLGIDESTFPADWRAVEQAIAGTHEGLEIRFLGAAGSPPLRARVEGLPPGAGVEPFALEESDRYAFVSSQAGGVLTATLGVAGDVDGFLISGPESDLKLTVETNGCADVTLSETRTLSSGSAVAIPRGAVHEALPRFERHSGCAGVFLWRAPRGARISPEAADEAVKKLRALGYLH